jgi:hypothetical protein
MFTHSQTSTLAFAIRFSGQQLCKTCHVVKELHEFARHMNGKFKRRVHCIECCRTGRRTPFIEGPKARARRRIRESKRKWQAGHRAALNRVAERYPAANLAGRAVRAALKTGKLTKAKTCQALGCNSSKCIEAHHHEYRDRAVWLEVAWLCAACHRSAHSRGWVDLKPELPRHFGNVPNLEPRPLQQEAA